MRKNLFVCIALFAFIFLSGPFLMAAGTSEQKTSSAGATPYYLKPDFKAYVEVKTPSILRPQDERVVKPVDKVAAKTIRIAYLGGQTNPFFDAVSAGVEAAKLELAPHNVIVDWIIPGASFATTDYNEAIDALVAKGYQGIVTMIFNEGSIPTVNRVVDGGVPVAAAIVNSKEPNKALFYIGQDLYQGGVTAAHALAKAINKKGKVAIVTGFYALYGHEQRRLGFEDTIKKEYPDITIVGRAENQDQADKAFNATTDFITANPDLAAVYNTAGGPSGVIEALIQAKKIDQVKVVCFYVPELAPYVKKGQCAAAIAQDAYAEGRDTCVRLFNYLMDGVLPPAQKLYTEMYVVTPDNLSDFIATKQGA